MRYALMPNRMLKKRSVITIPFIPPTENCRSSTNVLNHLDQWFDGIQPDIIHLNCGLHDFRFEAGLTRPQNSPEAYRFNLIKIFDALQYFNAKIIWATSTPFIEQWHNSIKPFKRYERDAVIYNTVSVELAKQYALPINDLYSHLVQMNLPSLVVEDGLHFNTSGSKIIAERIVHYIKQIGEV